MKESFKIIFAGGGTGGHLYSGIAIADVIRKKYPQAEILFVGTALGLENKIVPQEGYSLELIAASPLKGSGIALRLRSLMRLPKAYFQAKKILKKFRPDLVMGIGGYASGPTVLAAHFQKIFTAIIEQNAYPGFTNRKLGRFVDCVFIAFEKARTFFDAKKVLLLGNPVRHMEIVHAEKAQDKFTIFIMGGSQGAHALNQALIDALPFLKNFSQSLHFIHQTGEKDFELVQKEYQDQGFSAEVFPFNPKIAECYAKANFAICRSGAGTVTELQLNALPAILVPYPFAADDHQYFNAKEMLDKGAAKLIRNEELNGEIVAKNIEYFLNNRDQLAEMSELAKSLAHPHAAEEVLQHCLTEIS
ncbi:MAG: undecaprenyldiphospho-muramoylpentapeptide beta-N-acetylglucosaminyltransferase [Deltaproteobacteria bacterium]|nr:undecaprenyldiphospho-muramoylpentapeptide beta-N-acetylglucosaminyltransferase [Deltaproteobacteria bacterium]